MNSNYIIEARNLTKRYGKFTAVDGIDLGIQGGEIFGFLGPNGAGKTTTILMLMGFCEPTGGKVRVTGYEPTRNPIEVRKVLGYMPERVGFYDDLTARENLDYTGRLNGIEMSVLRDVVEEAITKVGLADKADQLVGKFSHGMKQRLGIADVMVKKPRVAIFDEPTSGIDPEGTDQVLNLIMDMAKDKVTVLISSHQLHQVQKICTRVGIFSRGKIVAAGSVDQLGREAFSKGKFNIVMPVAQLSAKVTEAIMSIPGVTAVEGTADSTSVTAEEDVSAKLEEIVLQSTGLKVQMKVEEFELEEVYLRYFKGS